MKAPTHSVKDYLRNQLSDFIEELDIILRDRFTLIGIKSYEEERILEAIKLLCEKSGRQCYLWDHADFYQRLTSYGPSPPTAKDPVSALENIERINGEAVIVLRDFHQCWHNQPKIIRKLRSLSHHLKYTKKTIIITYPHSQIPEELKDDIVQIDLPLPDSMQLKKILNKLLKTPGTKYQLTRRELEMVIQSALGLTSNQAQRVFSRAIVSGGELNVSDIEIIKKEKT